MKKEMTADVTIRDTKTPCLMVLFVEDSDPDTLAKPVFLHPVADEVWVTDFDTFMDAGFEDEHSIVPIKSHEGWGDVERVAHAWDYLGTIEEFGEPTSRQDAIDRQVAFAALWEFKTGKVLKFKEVA